MQGPPHVLQSRAMSIANREMKERAAQLHRTAIVVDTHCDTTPR